jgi:hypothetical protein
MSTPSGAFVPLDRRFAKIEKGNKERHDWSSVLQGWSEFGDPWSTLLSSWRVVILAEGGMGKTRELKAKVIELNEAGIPAFFVRIEDLLTLSLRDAIESTEDQNRLGA